MSALMGPYEASLIERYSGARARLRAPRSLPPKPVPRRLVSPFSPERNPDPPKPSPCVDLLAPPSWRTLAVLAAKKHGLSLKDLTGIERDKRTVAARDEAIALVYTHCAMSLPGVARRFNRDHTSILASLRRSGTPVRAHGFQWTPEHEAIVVRLWSQGMILRHIAAEIGPNVTPGMVSARVIKLGLPRRSGLPRTIPDWEAINARRRGKRGRGAREALRA